MRDIKIEVGEDIRTAATLPILTISPLRLISSGVNA
jgi:hypothetical protein